MRLFTKRTSHGHNVHGRRGSLNNGGADIAGRCPVRVHHGDSANPARPDGGRVRDLGNPSDHRRGSFGSRLKIGLFATTAALAWTLPFCVSAYSGTRDEILVSGGVNAPVAGSCFADGDSCQSYMVELEINATTTLALETFELFAYRTNNVNATTDLVLEIFQGSEQPNPSWLDPSVGTFMGSVILTHEYMSTSTGIYLNSFTFDNDIALMPNMKYWFVISPLDETPDAYGVEMMYKNGAWDITQTDTEKYWEYWDGEWRQVYRTISTQTYDRWPFKLFGTRTEITEGGESAVWETMEYPASGVTSTYDGSLSEYVPSINFSSEGAPVVGYERWSDNFIEYIGVASTTFPLCFVTPFFSLIDTIHGLTSYNQPNTVLMIGGAGIVPTTTFSLNETDDIIAETGAWYALDKIQTALLALAWLGFCWYVIDDLIELRRADGHERISKGVL